MTQTPPAVPRRSLTHRRLRVSIVLVLGLVGLFAYALSSSRTTDLVSECLLGGGLLPPEVACTYLEVLRDTDPNKRDPEPSLLASPASAHPQTIFGFTLAGYDATNPRAVALVDHFIDKGVDWG